MENKLTDENFEKSLSSTDKFVVVDFFATWCGPCTVLGPILEKIGEQMKDKIVVMKADVDDVPVNAQKLGVEKIPSVFLFKNGKPVSGFVGLVPEPEIIKWIEQNMTVSPTNENKQEKVDALKKEFAEYAKNNGIKLNPDEKVVERIIDGLLKNEEKYGEKYCPCRRVSGDKEEDKKKICPCIWHKDEIEKDGHCFCRLYVK